MLIKLNARIMTGLLKLIMYMAALNVRLMAKLFHAILVRAALFYIKILMALNHTVPDLANIHLLISALLT